MRTAKTLIRLGGCPGWSESSLGAHSFCWFCHVAAHLVRRCVRSGVYGVNLHLLNLGIRNLQNKIYAGLSVADWQQNLWPHCSICWLIWICKFYFNPAHFLNFQTYLSRSPAKPICSRVAWPGSSTSALLVVKKPKLFYSTLRVQRRLLSDCTDAQADLSLRWALVIL